MIIADIEIDASAIVHQERSVMRLHKPLRSVLRHAHVPAAASLLYRKRNEEYEREFREFIESISVTSEQIAGIIGMPELSIPEVKRYLQNDRANSLLARPRRDITSACLFPAARRARAGAAFR